MSVCDRRVLACSASDGGGEQPVRVRDRRVIACSAPDGGGEVDR